MEKKNYLIFAGGEDANFKVKGYIQATLEEAIAYCAELNKDQDTQGSVFACMELYQLPLEDRWKMLIPPGYTTAKKTAERWGVARDLVYRMCRDGRIDGALRHNRHWYIPVNAERHAIKSSGFASLVFMAAKWGLGYETVAHLCAEGSIPGVERSGRKWKIPKDAANPLEGYVLISHLAKEWGITRTCVSEYCKEGIINGVRRIGHCWYAPVNTKKPVDEKADYKPGYISASKTAERWSASCHFVRRVCREGRVEGAELFHGCWYIPENAVNPGKPRGNR